MTDLGRLPPHDADLERSFLCALLLGEPDLLPRVLATGLVADDLYLGAHRAILRAAETVHLASGGADHILIAQALESEDASRAPPGGWRQTVASIVSAATSPAFAVPYARTLRRLAMQRRVIEAAFRLGGEAYASNGSTADLARGAARSLLDLVAEHEAESRSAPLDALDMLQGGDDTVPWIIPGLLATGTTTMLAAKWRAGKTTWTLAALAGLARPRFVLGFEPREPVRALMLSEETPHLLAAKLRPFGFRRGELRILDRRGSHPPMPLADRLPPLLDDMRARGETVLVVDSWQFWASLQGEKENDAATVALAVRPLQKAAEDGFAVLLLHHLRKGEGEEGDAVRGSTALPASIDIVLEMRLLKGVGDGREITVRSRYPDSPQALVTRLAGADLLNLGSPELAARIDALPIIEAVLAAAKEPLDTDTIVAAAAVRRKDGLAALRALHAKGAIQRDGKGTKDEPYKWRKVGES